MEPADTRKRISTRERAEERREKKLKSITEAVDSGRLIVREMTPEERAMYPPRPPRDDRKRPVRR